MPPISPRLLSALLLFPGAAPLLAQVQTQTLPAGFENTNANSGSNEPFRVAEQQRHHFVYDAGEFVSSGPIRIHSIAFRPPANVTSWNAATYLDLRVALATAAVDYRAQNYRRYFEDNFASWPVELFEGDYTLASGSSAGPGPRPFVLSFPSANGYVYHPGLGRDLIVEVATPSRGGQANPLGLALELASGALGTVGGSDYLRRNDPVSAFIDIYPLADAVPVARLEYSAFSGVHADFGASRVRGFAPLAVQLSDRSFTTHPGGIASIAWDFENDGVFDASGPTATATYTAPGSYTVRLRVRDASGAASERIATQLVHVFAPPTSNTQSAEILNFHFDEVRGNRAFNAAATSFAPSFGTFPVSTWQGAANRAGFQANEPGFGCVAANAANPASHLFDTGWPVELCGAWTLAWWQRRVGAHGPETMRVASFGAEAKIETGGALLNSFELSISIPATRLRSNGGADSPLGVWTHVALVVDDNVGTAEWRLNGVVNASQTFTPGTFRMRSVRTLELGGGSSSSAVPYLRSYDLDDLRLYARVVPVAPRGPIFSWMPQRAVNTRYDVGCSSLGAIPAIDGNSAPALGNASYAITLAGLPAGSTATLVVGFTTHVFGIFPLDLSSLLGPGCALSPFPDFSFPVAAPSGSASFASPIPADPLLVGAHSYCQWLALGPSLALSPGLDIHLR
ncbi:MAG: PKD domain-containing protein [Planctomycetes bacterium]|nr:PKD domain-containing protein [Planctomycetota bacterium]